MSSLPKTDPEDRRKHLDHLQTVVTRMSAASSAAKGWLLPVITLTYGYALSERSDGVALLGIAAVAVFGLLDANYLNQERLFRILYVAVAQGTNDVPPFTLDPVLHNSLSGVNSELPTGWQAMPATIKRWFPPRSVWLSWAIAPLYGPLLLVGVAIYARVRCG